LKVSILKGKEKIILNFLGFLILMTLVVWLGFNAHLGGQAFSPALVIVLTVALIGIMIQKGRESRE
jgi:hypothetical protein